MKCKVPILSFLPQCRLRKKVNGEVLKLQAELLKLQAELLKLQAANFHALPTARKSDFARAQVAALAEILTFALMTEEILDFVSALEAFVCAALADMGEPADYCTEAVKIVDARNHLFRMAGKRATDEAEDIYALRELCRIDEDTMEMVPDRGRMAAIARNYF